MQLEAFTGGFLGDPGMRGRIDTRLFKDNVFYREKTVLRQLFFRWGVPHVLGCSGKRFRFSGSWERHIALQTGRRKRRRATG
ncbi:hypothetical protein [Mesorhizobium sp. M7D.F.Ca.US.004.01.2.1]|jgi:hypothetical protein|uniref:hypothetical protein n=1 Tax=Mesorhizobium sp. M7D.F.Ca.US.004.01.2.1 TaxID=2496738 RepID=UPI000FCB37D8|nr:hypothetical protein [Mesorhizobium sp. M7D.F.Ca.US.004.01.2.1]